MDWKQTSALIAACAAVVVWSRPVAAGEPKLPDGFSLELVADGFELPVDIVFAPDDRIFLAEKRGTVRIIENGVVLETPFIDLSDEVNNANDRGLLGIALDPDFESAPWVYLLYVVDPIPGPPEESGLTPTFGRLVRYLADPATNGNTAIPNSRQVLLGVKPEDGFIHCYRSHAIGTLRFANDGSLFVGAGDGAHFNLVDSGGEDPSCFTAPLFDPIHDIGAFRSQYLGSMAGKILRIDPDSGDGLMSNPFWTGNEHDVASKVWVTGLRNPFRFSLRPGSGSPETLYCGDVGWNKYEEINVGYGGENFGWPCYEGFGAQPNYFGEQPNHSGCDTIETPENPGPLTPPTVTFHHSNGNLSFPPGYDGHSVTGGVFYTGRCYPPVYRGRYFYADYIRGWMAVLEVDEQDQVVGATPFAAELDRPVDLEAHPETGDLYFLSILAGQLRRIVYQQQPADSDRDCDVDNLDFAAFQQCFRGSGVIVGAECQIFDLDDDDDIDLDDYEGFLDRHTGPF